MDYKEAGVNLQAANSFNNHLLSTFNVNLGFAAELDLSDYKSPIISTSTDGVGTKSVWQHRYGKYKEMGQDLVAMVFNDIICTNAKPLALLDYIAVDKIRSTELNQFIEGVDAATKYCGAKLVGGETAEMNTLPLNSMEVAGFGIGVREKEDTFNPVKRGDVLVGLPSSGLHANGFSLVRKVLANENLEDRYRGERLIDIICRPTILYYPYIQSLKNINVDIKAIANITGGGIKDNVERIIPNDLNIQLFWDWEVPFIFNLIQELGNISFDSMIETFNLGIGMVLIVNPKDISFINGKIIGQVI